MPRSHIRLLVTLVLLAAVAVGWSGAARATGSGGSVSAFRSSFSGPTHAPVLGAGEPDAPGTKAPPVRNTLVPSVVRGGPAALDWWQWTGRIWATWYRKAAR
jgi:hypothetical protein